MPMSARSEDIAEGNGVGAVDWHSLYGLRIGCVRYLNSRPLIEPYDGPVILDHPSVLAAALVRGELDVALVPVFEALRHADFPIADGVSISSFGPVWSVFVAHRGPIAAIREISLDPASLTSVNLCKVIFAEWGESVPAYLPEPVGGGESPSAERGKLLIGNQAIDFREQYGSEFNYLDLGEEWKRSTGLPFVFAVWLMRPETEHPERVAQAFRAIACRGKATIPQIVARHREYPQEFAAHYLTEYIRFGLGSEEKQAMGMFRELLCKHGLLTSEKRLLKFL